MAAEKIIPQFSLRGDDARSVRPKNHRITLVGRRSGIDITLDSNSVSEIHACLVARTDGLWLHDLGSRNGTTVNDHAITERALGNGDRLAFGGLAFTLTLDNAATGAATPAVARLRNTATGEVTQLSRPVTIVGRRQHSDIHLDDEAVSRVHALLVLCPDGLLVRDVGSRAGTRINGHRAGETLLTGGETLAIGHTTFAVEVDMPLTATSDEQVDDPLAALEDAFTIPAQAVPASDMHVAGDEIEFDDLVILDEPDLAETATSDEVDLDEQPVADIEQIAGEAVAVDAAPESEPDDQTDQTDLPVLPISDTPPPPDVPEEPMNEPPDDLRPESDVEQPAQPKRQPSPSPQDAVSPIEGLLAVNSAALRPARREASPEKSSPAEQQAHREALKQLESERREVADLKKQIEAMQASVETERNTLEVERRSLAEARKSLEEDTGRIESEHARLARLAKEFADERETLGKTQGDLAARHEELAEAHRRLDEAMARLSEDTQRVSADRQSLGAEREQLQQQSDNIARLESELQQEQSEAQARTQRLADQEQLLAQRNDELTHREQDVRSRSDQLQEEQAELQRRADHLAETTAAAQAVEDAARETAEKIEVQATRYETTSATDEDMQALMTGLLDDPQSDEPEDDVPLPSLERVSTETRVKVAADRKRTAALILSAAIVVVVALGAVFIVPLLHRDTPASDKVADRDTPPAPVEPTKEMPKEPDPAVSPMVAKDEMPKEPDPTDSPKVAVVEDTPEPVTPAKNPTEPEPAVEPPAENPPAKETDTAPEPVAPPADPQDNGTEPSDPLIAVASVEPEPTKAVPAESSDEQPPEPEPKTKPAVKEVPTDELVDEKPEPTVPGGIWPYRAPENLIAGPPEKDLKPTLAWAKNKLGNTLKKVDAAFGDKLSEPRQAIAMKLDDDLNRSLRKFAPWPYRSEIVLTDSGARIEQVATLVFIEFVYDGKPCLFVLKRRTGDGSVVPGTPGIFVFVPGAIQEHTVVLDTTREAIREPANP